MERAIGYLWVSTQRQQRSGLGIEAQRAAVERFAAAEQLTIAAEFVEFESGKGSDALDRRPQLAAALAAAKAALSTLRQRSQGPHGPLFANRDGGTLRPHSFRSKLRTFAGEAGLKRRVTPHMLRHTASTLLIESGVDIRIVQRLLGHSSIATTEIYTHVSDEALRTTLERANVLGALAVYRA